MDILYTKNIQTFCLVSSDSDFTPLIQRIRADGKELIGFGEQKAPEPFIAGCTRFPYLDDEPKQAAEGTGKTVDRPDPQARRSSGRGVGCSR